jgi:hypothetical protein
MVGIGTGAARWSRPANRVLMAHPEADRDFQDYVRAFRRGLLDRGWLEGHNIKLDVRWGALDDVALRRRSAQELVATQAA